MQLPAIDLAGRLGGGAGGARNRSDANPPGSGGANQLPIRNVRVNIGEDTPNVDIQSTVDLPSAAVPFNFDINVPVNLGIDMGSAQFAQVSVPSRLTRQATEAGSIDVAVGVQLSNEPQTQDSVAAFANQLFATGGNGNDRQGGGGGNAPAVIVRGIQLGGIQTFSQLPVLQVSANEVQQILASRVGGGGNGNGNNGGNGGGLDLNRIAQLVSGVTLAPSDTEPALNFASTVNVPGALPFIQSINLPQIQANLDVNGIPITQLSVNGARDIRGDQASQVPLQAKLLFDTSDQVQRQVSELPINQQAVFNAGGGGVRVGGIRTFERVRIQQQINVADLIARSGGGGRGAGNGQQQPPSSPGNGAPAFDLQSLVKINSVTTANDAPAVNIDSQVAIPEQLTQPLANVLRSASLGAIQVGLAAQNADFMSLQVGNVVIDPSNRNPVPAPVSVQFDNSQQARQGISNFVNSIRRQQTIGQVPLAVRGVQFGSASAPITTFSQISLALPVEAALAQVNQGQGQGQGGGNQGFQDPVAATLANVIRNLGGGRVEIQRANIEQSSTRHS
ncbi:hypothetical protein BCR44DRAFT_1025654 [Catenaria anguillulae PL171]|uniref:Uncharacterized protein n=1 Tax=Catenaria anguillulae PL171 TaxID=765915 RepID=A0A1Y2HT89_9FUNG|nr:hypothetical protein BCR44DRAFT_1025654 [Catenaria anguillulae PL171]